MLESKAPLSLSLYFLFQPLKNLTAFSRQDSNLYAAEKYDNVFSPKLEPLHC
jgi:hypothetical protein